MQDANSNRKVERKSAVIWILIIVLTLFFAIILIANASAVNQVFFSYVNLSVNSTDMHLWGEGIEARDFMSENCSYNKLNIPIIISRDIQNNETDGAILMRALATNNNMTLFWQDCMTNLSICNADRGYKDGYLNCTRDLPIANLNFQNCNNQLATLQNDLKDVKSQRTILLVACIGFGLGAYYLWNKNKIKKVESPLAKSFPPSNLRY